MGGISTPVEPAIGSTMTAAMVEASCSATMRSSSSARCAPHARAGPREKALCARSWVCGRWSTPASSAPKTLRLFDDAADRDAAEADAVIAALAADQPRARRPSPLRAVIGERDLERGVDRLRAGVGEEHVVEAARQPSATRRVGELEGDRVAHLERPARSPCSRGLRAGSPRRSRLAAVAGVDAPEPGRAVEHLAAVDASCSACPWRSTSRRGLALNCRFAVNGIQYGSRLFGTVVAALAYGSADIARSPS